MIHEVAIVISLAVIPLDGSRQPVTLEIHELLDIILGITTAVGFPLHTAIIIAVAIVVLWARLQVASLDPLGLWAFLL